MAIKKLIGDYADYNVWANNQMVEWFKTKPAEKLEQQIPSSFPTILKTLIHIWGTQRYWLSVLQQTEAPPSLSDTFKGTANDVFEGIIKQSTEFANHVSSLSEQELEKDCDWNTPWAKAVMPQFYFIQHCMNHSTYHRGQIVTIARNVGLTAPPMTDFTAFLISK
jgi:uncharacterized damage-inducible protein DinB